MPRPSPLHPRTAPLCSSYRFKEWAGFLAVASYETSIEPEYHALRQAAGLLDISPLCKYRVEGPDAAAFLAFVATRDLCDLDLGRVAYTCICDEQGKVIDDGTVARLDETRFRVTSAGPLFRWLGHHARGFDVQIEDVCETLAALALQGPQARRILASAVGASLDGLSYFGLASASLAGRDVEISRTGYTGDLGYEIWVRAEEALAVWDVLMEAGQPHDCLPCGLDALDVARIEAGFVLQDVDYFSAPHCLIEERKSSPHELGLSRTVQLDRPPFLGQRALFAEKRRGSPRNLVGLEIDWAELEALYDAHGLPASLPTRAWRTPLPVYLGARQVGQATSGTWSPILKRNLALASVESPLAAPGTRLQIEHTVEYRRETVTATVVPRPFFDPPRRRA